MEEKKLTAYKGFDENLCCRGFQYEIGKVFVKVLECAGVYKRTEEGKEAFLRFVESL